MDGNMDDLKRLVVDYPLNSESIVFELGGHVGVWSSAICDRFDPNIFVFEPVRDFYDILTSKFKHKNKMRIFNYGLSYKNDTETIYVNGDASSFIARPGIQQRATVRNIFDVVDEYSLSKIDLVQINIEGGEYALLEYILSSGRVDVFDNIQIQFHKNVENCESRRLDIKNGLSKTHHLKFDLPFVFEGWVKETKDSHI